MEGIRRRPTLVRVIWWPIGSILIDIAARALLSMLDSSATGMPQGSPESGGRGDSRDPAERA